MEDNTYLKVLNSLKTDGVILEQLLPTSDEVKFSPDKIIEILEGSYDLIYDDESDELKYIDSDGAIHLAPDLSSGVTQSSTWLCDRLPVPVLDFEQGGRLKQQDEAKAIYKLICIGIVFNDFKNEIKEVFTKYDFDKFQFKNVNTEYASMVEYLGTYLELGSIRINVVISSANIQISNAIEKKDSYWKSQLTLEEITEFAKISRDVKNVIIKYEREEKLNPNDMGKLSRVEKLQRIDERDLEIDAIINLSECATLYRISKFNSERLTPTVKRRIFTAAKKIAVTNVCEEKVVGREADERYSSLFSQYYREFVRMAVTTLPTREISKYKSNKLS